MSDEVLAHYATRRGRHENGLPHAIRYAAATRCSRRFRSRTTSNTGSAIQAMIRHHEYLNPAVIELRGVSKYYEGKRQVKALHEVDVTINGGEMVSLVGPSGSGKSTLLNLIGGLDRPTSGEVLVDGERLAGLPDDQLTRVRRDKIGFIFQFFNLLPTLSCLENVAIPLHLRGWSRSRIDERARELLTLVKLNARLDHLQ